nr:hypothetical protein [uncultured Methanolobus sp.]
MIAIVGFALFFKRRK